MIAAIPEWLRKDVPTGWRVDWRIDSYEAVSTAYRPRAPYHHMVIIGWLVPPDIPSVDAMRAEDV